jgi:exopolysaccharide production protein ExoQ
MVPILATTVCTAFILYLFFLELSRRDGPSGGIWVPFIWMFFAGGRFPSFWLNLRPTFSSSAEIAEGSPVDLAVFFALIVAGVLILAKRKVAWSKLLQANVWIWAYFLYCLLSAAWADEPFILAKRWVKDLGNPIMALVILTEQRPYFAVGAVLRRLAFVSLPASLLFVRYLPDLGRSYSATGEPLATGLAQDKNGLGLLCLLAGIYLSWELLQRRETTISTFSRQNKMITAILIAMLVWLLRTSDSQTSLVCLLVVVMILLLGRVPLVAQKPERILGILLCAAGAAWFALDVLHVWEVALTLLGRDATLTDRTDIWRIVTSFDVNPIIGVGYMSFWSGDRLEELWRLTDSHINQAHNGYLEQYLNLGYVGVAFIFGIILSGLLKVRRQMRVEPAAGMLRLCFIVPAILYNYTEASFYGMNNMWVLLLVGCIEVPRQSQPRTLPDRQWRRPVEHRRVGMMNRPTR